FAVRRTMACRICGDIVWGSPAYGRADSMDGRTEDTPRGLLWFVEPGPIFKVRQDTTVELVCRRCNCIRIGASFQADEYAASGRDVIDGHLAPSTSGSASSPRENPAHRYRRGVRCNHGGLAGAYGSCHHADRVRGWANSSGLMSQCRLL